MGPKSLSPGPCGRNRGVSTDQDPGALPVGQGPGVLGGAAGPSSPPGSPGAGALG